MALGYFNLSKNSGATDFTLTSVATYTGDVITGLAGMLGLTVWLALAYGSGSGVLKVYIQTSFDNGNTWVDIACWAPSNATATKVWNFSGLTPVTTPVTPSNGAMTDNTAQDGLLGDRVRVKAVVSSAVYAGSTLLSARMVAR